MISDQTNVLMCVCFHVKNFPTEGSNKKAPSECAALEGTVWRQGAHRGAGLAKSEKWFPELRGIGGWALAIGGESCVIQHAVLYCRVKNVRICSLIRPR